MRGMTGFRADPDSGDIDHSTDRCSAARQDRRIARQRINRLASRRARAPGHSDSFSGQHDHCRTFDDTGEPAPADDGTRRHERKLQLHAPRRHRAECHRVWQWARHLADMVKEGLALNFIGVMVITMVCYLLVN